MISLSSESIKLHTKLYIDTIANGTKASLMFDDFMSNTLDSLYGNVEFPSVVKLPRSMEEMKRKDFTPSEEVVLSPPFLDNHPIWRGNTLNGFVLRGCGYVNNDSRSPCHIALDDNVPHGLLAGATGHGKSVTLNSVIMMGALEYPPWEVQYVLVDACDTRLLSLNRNDGVTS